MSAPFDGFGVFYVLCSLQALLGLLWTLRWIGPNSVLGIRTQKTLSNPVIWFRTHAFWGRTQLLSAGVALLGLFVVSGVGGERAFQLAFVIVGIPIAISVVCLWVYLERV